MTTSPLSNRLLNTHNELYSSPTAASPTQVPFVSRLPALEPDGGTDLLKFITWGYANFPASANEPRVSHGVLISFTIDYKRATTPEHLQAFEDGYHNGKPEDIAGYRPGMTVEGLMGLSTQSSSIAQIGTLSRLITERIQQYAPKRQWADNTTPSNRSDSPPSAFSQALAKRNNLKTLGQKLDDIIAQLASDAPPQTISTALGAARMTLQGDSSPVARSVSVDAFTTSQGFTRPNDYPSLVNLAKQVKDQALVHPLGSFRGALSWPVPLSTDEQTRLTTFAQNHAHHLGTKPTVANTQGGVLEFLRYQLSFWSDTLKNPAKLLDALLDSPQATSMGKALRENMQGLATDSSDTDFLLAAINLQLDPESITTFDRNKVAGFDLASPEHFGKPLSAVVERLQQHLIDQGKSSHATAGASAHLLLASRAPVFLVKDIPSNVTYGSPAWLNLTVAVATIEGQTPGRVANMTFAQAMHEAQFANPTDKTIRENAQKAALLDWGAANGVMAKKDDALYTPEDLKTLFDVFNARITQMKSATQALDKELASRKEMALAELSKRFPGKEALFEVKAIKVLRRYKPDNGSDERETVTLAGMHSMLDIAMMSSKDRNLVFRSDDSRLPITELNANKQFNVLDAFNAELAKGIEAKKNAIKTSIQHLISLLPLEDRQNFQYGEVSFFQQKAYRLGTGLFDSKTPLPTDKALMVSTTLNGKTTAYAIDFNKGSITHALPWQAAAYQRQDGSRVDKSEPFGDVLPAQTPPQPLGVPSNSFASPRTLAIADAFVKHLDLDSQDIKDEAKGLTTDEQRDKKIAHIVDVVLDVIPFRSAIVNFQKGNVGEGVFDLAVDLFGFLTSGAGAVGKAIKIGNTALSTVTKAYKVAKVIGAATLSAFNPLDGVGDLALGAASLAGKGLKQIGAKALQGANKLRGATGSYDLLHAVSKEHGPTLIGTYKVGDVEIQGVAVLKNDQWFKYDHVLKRPYGTPIADFSPRGAPLQRNVLRGSAEDESVKLFNNLTSARSAANRSAFESGYLRGRLESLPGYRPGMSSKQLRALATANNRRPDEMGILARELKKAYIEDGKYTSALLTQDVAGPGVKITPVSQMHYNACVDLPSIGECAGMSYAMALAIHAGKEDQFIKNMLKVADAPKTPGADKFINDLRDLQARVQKTQDFHYGVRPITAGHEEIISKLARFQTSTTVRIGTLDHAMLAGVRVENGKKEWFFYDPNAGLVKFNNSMAMQEGMEKVLNSGKLAATNNTLKSPAGGRLYNVSIFDPSDVNRPGIDANAAADLSDIAL